MNTIFIHHRSAHHAKNSGYSRLLDYFPNAKKIYGLESMSYKLAKTISRLSSKKAGLYDSSSVMKEYELYKSLQSAKKENVTIHYLNAERDIRYITKLYAGKKNFNFVGTFHRPPAILAQRIKNLNYLKQLDAAVTVGKNQVAFLQEWLNIEQVEYIPHGVDVNFFRPLEDSSSRSFKKMLFVGKHLRDFDILNKTIKALLPNKKDLYLDVVVGKSYTKFIEKHERVTFYSNLNDLELKRKYQEADLLLLPLKDATACNSILEALACGKPIITSNVGGIPEYLNKTDNILCPPNDADAFVANSLELLYNDSKLSQLAIQSREKSLDYAWDKVALQIESFHNKTISING
ncbi:glycosyltransferase family 4 protein [Haloflavibacter putidus]|uniref:Glycosyltransferase family 4 protein n=1 Tax=Haloflavibacter putidus TaxID=2576776 RepID=A0A507Z7W8_9FLAO|nr:glycosyltransferase family 4 protein [Haloflavibacter putidus]TQD33816.1 glycosyltransferase family 4 protein [Haloflavibacter putidus]